MSKEYCIEFTLVFSRQNIRKVEERDVQELVSSSSDSPSVTLQNAHSHNHSTSGKNRNLLEQAE
jgi:hypothetical protein